MNAFNVRIEFSDTKEDEDKYDILDMLEYGGNFYMKPMFKFFKKIDEQTYNTIYNAYELSSRRDEDLNKIIESGLDFDSFYEKSWNHAEKISREQSNYFVSKFFTTHSVY